jgi:hypothetical protein
MRTGTKHQPLTVCRVRQGRKVEAVDKLRERRGRARRKTAAIEGQAAAQQFDPEQLARPQRLGMGRVVGQRIMADANPRLAPGEGPERKPVRPLACGKQQVQLGIMGGLRL